MNETDIFDLGRNGIISQKAMTTHLNLDDVWSDRLADVRGYLMKEAQHQTDVEVLNQLKGIIGETKTKSKEDKVIDIAKGAFEDHFGMSITEYQTIYDMILEKNPEKLV